MTDDELDDRIDEEALEFAVKFHGTIVALVLGLIFAGGIILAILFSGE